MVFCSFLCGPWHSLHETNTQSKKLFSFNKFFWPEPKEPKIQGKTNTLLFRRANSQKDSNVLYFSFLFAIKS